MILRTLLPLLLSLLSFSAQAILITYNNEADFAAIGADQRRYDFEVDSGFPTGSYTAADSLIGEFDGIQFNATTIIPGLAPVSGTQAMSGANGTYSAATLNFTDPSRRITGFGFYGEDLRNQESIRVSADFQSAGIRIFDIRLGAEAELTPIYFGAYDADDTLRSLSIISLDDSGLNRAWYLDDLSLTSTAVPLPASLPLLLGGLVLLGRFISFSSKRH